MVSRSIAAAKPRRGERSRRARLLGVRQWNAEALEGRRLLASFAQFEGIAYLPNATGTRFERYDVANEQWLGAVTLAGAPGGLTASHVDADGIFAAFGTSVIRYRFDGSAATPLATTSYPVQQIHSDGNLLFVNHSSGATGRVTSIDKATNAVIDTRTQAGASVMASSIAPAANKIFGRTAGVSPSDVASVFYDDRGRFIDGGRSSRAVDQSATQTWASPASDWFADDSGTVYATATLAPFNSFGTRIDDLAFTPAGWTVALYGGTLRGFAPATHLPTGSATLGSPATQLVANAGGVIAFAPDAASPHGYSTQVVPLAALKAPEPDRPTDPTNLVYQPDDVELAADGTVLLLSTSHKSIFRFDPETLTYRPTIALEGAPRFMAYSAENASVYVAYDTGRISRIDLAVAQPVERPFATLPGMPVGLAAAGKFVLGAANTSYSVYTHFSFGPDGALLSSRFNDSSAEYVYSPANGKIFFISANVSPTDLVSEVIGADGKIGAVFSSPHHGSEGFWYPIRVSPDGSTVLLGTGKSYDATTLERAPNALANRVADIAWLGGDVYTIRALEGNVQFQRWVGTSFVPSDTAPAEGLPIAVRAISGGRLLGVFRSKVGVPVFRVMDAELRTLGSTTPPPPAPLENATVTVNVSGNPVEGAGRLSVGASATGMGYGQSIVSFDFDFDYDGATFDTERSTGVGFTLDLNYSVADGPSTRTVAVRATDTFGQTAIRTRTITFANVAPLATFAASLDDVADRQAVTYSFANARDAGAADVAAGFRYSFDFNNDGDYDDAADISDSTSASATHRWATPGTYVVRGRIADKDGGATTYTQSLTVSDNTNLAGGKPAAASGSLADHPASNATDASPETEWRAPASDAAWLQVDLAAFYRLTSLVIGFNEGAPNAFQVQTSTNGSTWATVHSRANNTDATVSVSLQAGTSGVRFVRLQFTKRNGTTSYRVGDLRVYGLLGKPPAPANVSWAPLSPLNEGATVSLRGTTPPLGTGQTIEQWEWDLDYDGQRFDVDAIGATLPLTLPDSAVSRPVAVRVTDNYGQVALGYRQLKPTNVAPRATFAATSAAPGKATATFSDVTDPSAADAAAGFRYSFDFNGDGDFADPGEVDRGTSPTATGTFFLGGTYAVTGYVYDRDGSYSTYASPVTVAAPAKPAMPSDFGFAPVDVAEGQQAALVGRVAGLASGQSIVKWEYDFDYDGLTFTADAVGQTAGFSAFGIDGNASRTLGVRVTDNYGQVATAAQALTIKNAAPASQFSLVGVYNNGRGDVTATFYGQTDVSEADRAAGFRYAYDFNGDGDFADPDDVADTASASWTRSYPSAGNYTVIGRITDKDGGATLITRAVFVLAPSGPKPSIGVGTAYEGQQLMLYGDATNDGVQATAKWEWDFDYADGTFTVAATGQYPLFDTRGLDGPTSRLVALRVTDTAGRTAIATATVSILNAIPSADFAFVANANGTATATFSNVTDASSADVIAGFRYSFDFNNDGDFIDAGDVRDSTSPSATFAPAASGTVIVNARVADKDGGYLAYGKSASVTVPTPPTTPAPLAGTPIGTAGSYNNNGLTIAKAFDGDLATYFDGPKGTGMWVGLDLGAARAVTSVQYAPRVGWAARMVGGLFQGSNTADFSGGVVTLATVTVAPPANAMTTLPVADPTAFRYVRFLSPTNGYGNVAELKFFGTAGTTTPTNPTTPTDPTTPTAGVLTGTPFGTAGSFNNGGATIDRAFDGALASYVDLAKPDGNVIGLDFGAAKTVTQIRFAPRAGWAARMVGGRFEGSNVADFSGGGVATLHTVAAAPAEGVLTSVNVTAAATAFRYVRYVAPARSYGNVAELQFVGTAAPTTPPPPTNPTTPTQWTGSAIGTVGSYQNNGLTAAKAFDGDLSSYFDGPTGTGMWAGLDLGVARTITSIRYAPRVGWSGRMVGGMFQASNTADFSFYTTIATVWTKPAEGVLTSAAVSDPMAYRYVRYLGPAGSYGNVAEIRFFG